MHTSRSRRRRSTPCKRGIASSPRIEERNLARAKAQRRKQGPVCPTTRWSIFRARRTAELLALEALVLKSEQALVISPPPSYEEQKTLADHADFDFANIKELLDDGNVSRLDAIRLNNEFRRIGPERDRLLKNEMAQVEAQLQFYENALTNVELELLQDSLHDRFEHDLLRERLAVVAVGRGGGPGSRARDEAPVASDATPARPREAHATGASHTLVQVTRRLGILDREYGFIRTTYLLGPRPGADRAVDPHAGGPRV